MSAALQLQQREVLAALQMIFAAVDRESLVVLCLHLFSMREMMSVWQWANK